MPWYTPTSTNQMPTGFSEESLTPRSTAWAAGLKEGLTNTLPGLAYDAGRRVRGAIDQPSIITQSDAQKRAQDAGVQVNFPEDGVSEGAANAMIERAYGKKRRRNLMETSNMNGIEKLGSQIVGGAADPVNLLFLPLGLPEMAAKAGIGAVLRRVAFGVAEGAAVTAAAEPAYNRLANYVGDDYSMADSMVNIAMGGVLGGAFHLGGALISHAAERKVAGPTALRQVMSDIPVNVDNEVRSVFDRRENGTLADNRTADAWQEINTLATKMEADGDQRMDWGSLREEAEHTLKFEPAETRLEDRPGEPRLRDDSGRPIEPPSAPNYNRLSEISKQLDDIRAEDPTVPKLTDVGANDIARATEPTPLAAGTTEPGLAPTYRSPDIDAEIKSVDTKAAEVSQVKVPEAVEPGQPDAELAALATDDIKQAKEIAKTLDREDPLARELADIDENAKEVDNFTDAFASALRCALRKGTP